MKKRKNDSYFTKKDYDNFDINDTRYYGLFYKGKDDSFQVKIDPKRFQIINMYNFSNDMLKVINKRKTHYFYPAKPYRNSYKCNLVQDTINNIKSQWDKYYKGLIKDAINKINKPEHLTIGDCELFNCGILEPDEANMWAMHENMVNSYKYQHETSSVICSLYAQFFHLFASQIEALTLKILDYSNHFDRNTLYGIKLPNNKTVIDLPSFKYHNELYTIWNFIKHNSISTYNKVKDSFPELLLNPKADFQSGELAIHYLNFSDELLNKLFLGVSNFLYELCESYFDENRQEAQWNYSAFFYSIVYDTREEYTNPLGLPSYI